MSVKVAYNQVQKLRKNEFDVSRHIDFVKRIANTFYNKIPVSLCIDDLIQVGLIALLEVSGKFDLQLSDSFEAFAHKRVKGAMIDLIRKNLPITKEKLLVIKKANYYIDQYRIENGVSPKNSDVAAYLGISLDSYHKIFFEYQSIFQCDFDKVSLFDDSIIPSELIIEQEETKRMLIDELKSLPDKNQKIVSLYYVEEFSYAEIAKIFSLSESRIAQIIKASLIELRTKIRKRIENDSKRI